MDVVTDLVIAPFNEIVEKATEAHSNAGDGKDMLAESQKLIRGAERILKTVVPLCARLHGEYGVHFVDELKQHDEIAKYRLELNNLLWDFEDYMEPDTFEKEPYTNLQQLCKNAGLGIGEILKRMKLEPVVRPQADGPASPASTSTAHVPAIQPQTPSREGGLNIMMQHGHSEAPLPTPERREDEEERMVTPPPPPPASDPWDIKRPHSIDTGLPTPDHEHIQRRPPVSSGDSDIVSPTSPVPDARLLLGSSPRRLDIGVMMMEAEERQRRMQLDERAAATPQEATEPAEFLNGNPFRNSTRSVQSAASLPSNQGVQLRDMPPPTCTATILPPREHRDSQASSVQSRESMRGSISPAVAGSRGSMQSMPEDPDSITGGNVNDEHRSPLHRAPTIPPNFPPGVHDGIEAVPREYNAGEGLIPVDSESPGLSLPPAARTPSLPARDCSLGLTSSFFLYKGFCEGAKETARGGSGIKKVKKPGFAGPHSVARCANCDYESDMHHLEMDQKQSEAENFACAGVGYRVRFLQKSHMATKRSDEELYGCAFCAHTQRTIEECDATVFFSARKLFEHLARHPRPLPQVPGFVVVEEAEVPFNLRNNYDLHFKRPAVPSPLEGLREEIASLPAATALRAVRKMYGMRLLHDHTPAFELAEGARITGIEFPSKYQGEWALGWHDGAKKSVPFDVIRLEPPPKNEVRMGGTSTTMAVARWRFAPKAKDGSEWLRFDKGDVITSISWAYADHWCWSGTNSKGKWGIFPQHFIDTNTVRELAASDRASIVSNEHKKFRFSISRKGGARPPSFSGPAGGRSL